MLYVVTCVSEIIFFFFKQKTAYEMRISDWSSDVCSSDLVLDEATEGLAPLIRQEIWRALGELKANGLSQIVIDKNVGALLDLADHHYVIQKGCVVWQGGSEALRRTPDVIHQYLDRKSVV